MLARIARLVPRLKAQHPGLYERVIRIGWNAKSCSLIAEELHLFDRDGKTPTISEFLDKLEERL